MTAKKALKSPIGEDVEVEPPGIPKSAAPGSKPPEWERDCALLRLCEV